MAIWNQSRQLRVEVREAIIVGLSVLVQFSARRNNRIIL